MAPSERLEPKGKGHRHCGSKEREHMDVEFGIQNVARPVNFTTSESEDTISKVIDDALASKEPIHITDDKGRHIIVPANALGYAIVGSETKHAVGFGQ